MLRHAGPWFLSLTLYLRAILAVRRGNPDEAIAWCVKASHRIRELHDKFAFVYALVPLAAAAALKGDDAWAARILGAAGRRHRTHGCDGCRSSRCTTSENRRNGRRAHASARSGGRGRTRRGAASSIDALLKDIDAALGRGGAWKSTRRLDGALVAVRVVNRQPEARISKRQESELRGRPKIPRHPSCGIETWRSGFCPRAASSATEETVHDIRESRCFSSPACGASSC